MTDRSVQPPAVEQKATAKTTSPAVEILTSGELLRRLGRKVEGVNLLEVEKYLRSSKVLRSTCQLQTMIDLLLMNRSLVRYQDIARRRWRKLPLKVSLVMGVVGPQLNSIDEADPKKLAKLSRLSATTPPLHVVEDFIVSLTAANDGTYHLANETQKIESISP